MVLEKGGIGASDGDFSSQTTEKEARMAGSW